MNREHKIYCKYHQEVPQLLKDQLKEAADSITNLDNKMESIHDEMKAFKENNAEAEDLQELQINNERFQLQVNFSQPECLKKIRGKII